MSAKAKSCVLWRCWSKENEWDSAPREWVVPHSKLVEGSVVLGGTVQFSGRIQLWLTGGFQAAACIG